MGFYLAMFACNLMIPAAMIAGGYFMYRKPPKQINDFLGYRTNQSKKNPETWKFSHEYCGKLWLKIGTAVLLLSILVQISFVHADEDTIGTVTVLLEGIQLAVLLGSIFFVERALKRTFDKEGNRRTENDTIF